MKKCTKDMRVANRAVKGQARYCAKAGHCLWSEWQNVRVALSPNNDTPADRLKRYYKSKKEESLQWQLDAFEEVLGILVDWLGDFSLEVNWVEKAKDLQAATNTRSYNQQAGPLQNTVTLAVRHKQGGAGMGCILHSILNADDLSSEDDSKSDGEELLEDPLLPTQGQEETRDWTQPEWQEKDSQDMAISKDVIWSIS